MFNNEQTNLLRSQLGLMKCKTLLLGRGGHAHHLLDLMESTGNELPTVALDANSPFHGTKQDPLFVIGQDDFLSQAPSWGFTHFLVAVGSVKSPLLKATLFEKAQAVGLIPRSFYHPSALVSPKAHLGNGVHIFGHCVVSVGASLGNNVLVNTHSNVGHDSVIGDHVHLGPKSCVCGNVSIGPFSHIGANSTIKQGISIGHHVTIGLGSVVVKDIPDYSTAYGVPAKIIPN